MEEMKASVMAICTVSAVICVLDSLIANTRLRSRMKFLLDLFMILTAIAPFMKGLPEVDISAVEGSAALDMSTAEEVYGDELRKQASYNISSVLLGELRRAGINCSKIETHVNISDDGSISISKVVIKADDAKGAEELIKRSLGDETEVINEDDR